jgi:hypothetical protein
MRKRIHLNGIEHDYFILFDVWGSQDARKAAHGA